MENLKKSLNNLIKTLMDFVKGQVKDKNLETQAGTKLYETALSFIGVDVTPKDEVSDDVACAQCVNAVHEKAFGEPIGGGASTYWLYIALKNHRNFVEVEEPKAGDVVISYTGDPKGGKNGIKNGHTGIVLTEGRIASNNSKSGLWEAYYNLFTWDYRYHTLGGYDTHYFRRV